MTVHLSWPFLAIGVGVLVGGVVGIAVVVRAKLRGTRMSGDALWLISLGTGLLIIATVLFIAVPGWVVNERDFEVPAGATPTAPSAAERQKANTDARTAALALMAGAGAALATIFAGRTFFLTRRGQLSDRQAKAIEQLHSDEEGIRMAAIGALERIAIESPNDHPRIMELLAHFLRNRGRVEATPPADVRAACRAIVERRVANDRNLVFDLTGADLRGTDLKGIVLRRALLRGSQLDGVVFEAADLRGADLSEARAASAQFRRARLARAVLRGVDLTTATLDGVDARNADLRDAYLDSASFAGAVLRDANMQGVLAPFVAMDRADARRADLTDADCRDGTANRLNLRDATVTRLSLQGAAAPSLDLRGAGATQLNLRQAVAPGLKLQNARANGADLRDADLTSANFTGADLTDVNLDGALLDGAVGLN